MSEMKDKSENLPTDVPKGKIQPETAFRIGLLAVYAVAVIIGLAHHEMWRDELRAWNIVNYSGGIGGIYRELRFEGHGPLWYLLLYFVSLVTDSPVGMQVLHGVLAVGTVALLSWLPVTRLQKVLLAFGYYFFFEYALISRLYVLTMLACLMCCVGWRLRKEGGRPTVFFVGLTLLPLSGAYGVMLAGTWACLIGFEGIMRKRIDKSMIVGAALFLVSTAASLAIIIPDKNCAIDQMKWFFILSWLRLIESLNTIALGLFPIIYRPELSWSCLQKPHSSYTFAALGVVVVLAVAWALRKDMEALVFYLVATLGIVLFSYVKLIGAPRHFGHLFLVLVCAVSLLGKEALRKNRLLSILFLAVGISQFAGGIRAYVTDLKRPFSCARETSIFLNYYYPDTPIYLDWHATGDSFAGYLGRPMYFPKRDHYGYFCSQIGKDKPITFNEIVRLACNGSKVLGKPVLLVISYPSSIPDGWEQCRIRKVFDSRDNAMVPDEMFHVYHIEPIPQRKKDQP